MRISKALGFLAVFLPSIAFGLPNQELNVDSVDTGSEVSTVNDNFRRLNAGKADVAPRGLNPFSDSKYDLGEPDREWRRAYVDGVIASSMTVSTLTVNSLSASTVTAVQLNVANINGTFIGMGRNRIINGGMRISQRLVYSTATINSTTGQYTIDRWIGLGQGSEGVFGVARTSVTIPTGHPMALRATVTTADSSISSTQTYTIRQRIEGNNIVDYLFGTSSAKTVTLSFWVRSSVTGTFSGSLQNSAANRSYPFTYTISSANTYEQKSVTIAGDTSGTWLNTEGIGLAVIFDLGSGTSVKGTSGAWAASNYVGATGATNLISTVNATWYLTGVQLEVGSTATAFEYRDMGTEIGLCQRYYEKSYELETAPGTSTTVGMQTFMITGAFGGAYGAERPLKTRKRTTPTVTSYSSTGASGTVRDLIGAADIAVTPAGMGESSTGRPDRTAGNFAASNPYAWHWATDSEL